MGTTLAEIRASGWLELYVLGLLAPNEQVQVDQALIQFPELRQDLDEIAQAAEAFAKANSVVPSAEVLDKTLETITTTSAAPSQTSSPASNSLPFGLGGLALLFAASAFYFWNANQASTQALLEAEKAVVECEDRARATNQQIALLEDIQRNDNQVVAIDATDRYPETSILLYNNENTSRNYLVLADLPPLEQGQAYQLWSLKADSAPIPLDVFDGSTAVLPVTYVDGTANYAITIEAAQGAESPNLEQLIGVFGLTG